MSNIFEAVNKGKGELADFMLPMVGVQNESSAPCQQGTSESGPAQPVTIANPAPAAPMPDAFFPRQIRTLRLRIAAPSPLLPFEDNRSHASEQYRMLRTKISQHPKQPRLIVVSSAASRDGKTTTAVNMAGALSLKNEAKVVLLDADLRKSTIHLQLGLPERPGLVDVLTGACSIEQALVQAQEFPNLYVLSAGTLASNPAELLDSVEWPKLCTRLCNSFRYIVVDSPPLAGVADYDLIQAVADGIILVVRPDHTKRPLCQKALATVSKEKFLGVLMNCVPASFLTPETHPDYYSGREPRRDVNGQGVGTTA